MGLFRLFLPAFLIAFTGPFLAGQDCTLRLQGQLLSGGEGQPLASATIWLQESERGAISGEDGRFTFTDLCPGTYHLHFSYVGFQERTVEVALQKDTSLLLRLLPTPMLIEQVVVKGEAIPLKDLQASETLEGRELSSARGQNLGAALRQLSGVNSLNTGATISKPMIHGMHSNRVLLLNNGVRLEGQQWGAEHAPEIDPYLAEQVRVVKGASSVRYGSDAIGGVILVEPRHLPTDKGIGGELNLQGLSNGRTGVASASLEGNLGGKFPLAGRIQGTLKRGGNLRAPDYFLDNTGVKEQNFSWALGLDKDRWHAEAYYSIFYTEIGILGDAHIGNLTDLKNAIARGRPIEDGHFSYRLGRPIQKVLHELTKADLAYRTGELGELSLQLSRQFNRRQEFDAHRPFGTLPEEAIDPDIEFEITTWTGDLNWHHHSRKGWRGDIGAQFIRQVNTTDRGGLIPNYENWSGSVWWIERWKRLPSPFEFEVGIRYDGRWMSAGQQAQQELDDQRRFHNVSGSVGMAYQITPRLRANLTGATAWRAPHVSELFSEGVHHGSAAYEKGNPDLVSERAFNTALNFSWDDEQRFFADLNLYYNLIRDFIYLQPTGEPVLTIRGSFPAFDYRQANVRIMGLDWTARYRISDRFTLDSRASLLRARNQTIDDYLIFMPADRFQHGLRYTFKTRQKEEEEAPYLRIGMTNVLRQSRVPADTDYAPPPDGYTLLGFEAGATLRIGRQPFHWTFTVTNLLNTEYRDYLNRLRYYAHEMGTNVSLQLQIPFYHYFKP